MLVVGVSDPGRQRDPGRVEGSFTQGRDPDSSVSWVASEEQLTVTSSFLVMPRTLAGCLLRNACWASRRLLASQLQSCSLMLGVEAVPPASVTMYACERGAALLHPRMGAMLLLFDGPSAARAISVHEVRPPPLSRAPRRRVRPSLVHGLPLHADDCHRAHE